MSGSLANASAKLDVESLNKLLEKVITDVLVLKKYIFEEQKESRKESSDCKMAEISIPVFDGVDYAHWKKRITMFLKLKKCATVIEREKASTDKEDEWAENDLKAINYIYSAISNKQLEFVGNLETAYKIIKKFDEMYLKESTALQIIFRNKLEKIRLKNYQDSSVFINDFEKAVNELKAAGATVTEKEKLNYMLRTLPDSYSYIGDLIDTLKEEDQTADYVINKIKMIEIKDKASESFSSNGKSNAFVSESKGHEKQQGRTCYGCGAVGHFKKDCPQVSNSWNRVQRGGRQQYRGNGTQRGAWRSRSRGRGRGSSEQRGRNTGNERPHSNCSFGAFTAKIIESDNYVAYSEMKGKQIDWLLDSGCTDHVVNRDDIFVKCIELKNPVNVNIGDGRGLKATKVGQISSYFKVYDKFVRIDMSNVFYVQDMTANLISLSKVTDKNKVVAQNNSAKIYNNEGMLLAIAFKVDKLYKMQSQIRNEVSIKANLMNTEKLQEMSLKEKWHRKLGHVNFKYLNLLCNNELVDGLPTELENEYMKCAICIENKMHNLPFKNDRTKAKEILEIIHTDLNGPHNTIGLNGEKYFLTFIDDYSKLARVNPIKSKDEVYDCLVSYINEVENITGKRIKKLRCDNGKEYMNKRIFDLVKEKGILLDTCPPYVHELNGTAERYNRSIMDIARCLLTEAKIDRRFWPEVVCAAAYLKNRTLANTAELKTPYEIFFGNKPNVNHLKLYGSRVFVRVPEQRRRSKWDKKAELGILVGYDKVGYRVLINNRIIVARHVDVVEKDVNCIGLSDRDEFESKSETSDDEIFDSKSDLSNDFRDAENENDKKSDEVESNDRPKRNIKPPARFDDNYVYNCICVNYCNVNNPKTFEEALGSSDSKNWKEAMQKEIDCLNKNKTWVLVDKPMNKKVLDVKWVYTKKDENKFKARLVVRGFQQKEIIEDIYSPVAKMQTLKILLSYCCKEGLLIDQMDVETAFLNGKVKSEVYIKQAQGFENKSDKVCKLQKALYGLRESPRAWYECFDEFMKNLGFKTSKIDNCLYSMNNEKDSVYVVLFVDDLLICCKSQKTIEMIKGKFSERFCMKDMGKVKNYLGINIDYDYKNYKMFLSQKNYIESLGNKYKLENAKLYNTPMEVDLKLDLAEKTENDLKYRNLIGELMYISSGTRPDISYSVNYLSRFQNCYNETHFKYAMRILKYVYLTKDLRLMYKKNDNVSVVDCFVDSDWAGDNLDRKSTSGYVIRFCGNVVYWKTRKQNSVTKSSTSAEYVALSEAVSELKLIKDLIEIFDLKFENPINIYEDNSGAISIAKFGNFTKNSKYIEVHYHFVNENYLKGIIDIVKVESENNIADIFTKSLGRSKFEKFRSMLNLVN